MPAIITLTLHEEELGEICDLMERALDAIEDETFWPCEEPEDEDSRQKKLAVGRALFDSLVDKLQGKAR